MYPLSLFIDIEMIQEILVKSVTMDGMPSEASADESPWEKVGISEI